MLRYVSFVSLSLVLLLNKNIYISRKPFQQRPFTNTPVFVPTLLIYERLFCLFILLTFININSARLAHEDATAQHPA